MGDATEDGVAASATTARIARRVHALRRQHGLSLEALSARCGVSKSMISLIERGESSPTAVVLERLAAGLGVALASLFDDDAAPASPLSRRDAQLQWRDPASGYVRRNLSPPNHPSPLQLVAVELPPRLPPLLTVTAEAATVEPLISRAPPLIVVAPV